MRSVTSSEIRTENVGLVGLGDMIRPGGSGAGRTGARGAGRRFRSRARGAGQRSAPPCAPANAATLSFIIN